MRAAAVFVLSPIGALLALGLLFAPHTVHAAATFTRGDAYPFVSSIALRAGGEFISASAKTREDVVVVISVDPGPTPGNSISGSDNHLFTENGSYTFYFTDAFGATGSSTVTIDAIDRTPPVITIASYATTSTNQSVMVTATTDKGTLNVDTYEFLSNGAFDFVATDEAGNVSTSTVTISHIDTVAPLITLRGDAVTQVKVNSAYTEQGAEALDAVDGAVRITTEGSVDTGTLGTYTLTYTATDAAGNTASTSRTVSVIRGSSGGGGGGGNRVILPEATVGQVLGASTYNFTRNLVYRNSGADVTALQEVLVIAGYLTEAPTGYFGKKTEAALKAYQAARGITQTGTLGPVTRLAMNRDAIPVSKTATSSVSAQIALLLAQVQLLQSRLAGLRGS